MGQLKAFFFNCNSLVLEAKHRYYVHVLVVSPWLCSVHMSRYWDGYPSFGEKFEKEAFRYCKILEISLSVLVLLSWPKICREQLIASSAIAKIHNAFLSQSLPL